MMNLRFAMLALAGGLALYAGGYAGDRAYGSVVVHVANDGALDVNVFAVRGEARQRLAFVRSFEVMEIELGPEFVPSGTLTLLVDPVGSPEFYRTPPILVSGRTIVDLRIAHVLSNSVYQVHYEGDPIASLPRD